MVGVGGGADGEEHDEEEGVEVEEGGLDIASARGRKGAGTGGEGGKRTILGTRCV